VIVRWFTTRHDKATDSNLTSISSDGIEGICFPISYLRILLLCLLNPTSCFICLLDTAKSVAFRFLFADTIENYSRILAAALSIVSLGDDPFFGLLFLDQECIKQAIYFSGGSSTSADFITAIVKPLKNPLREVDKVSVRGKDWNTKY